MELGDLHAVFEKERAVRHFSKAQFSAIFVVNCAIQLHSA